MLKQATHKSVRFFGNLAWVIGVVNFVIEQIKLLKSTASFHESLMWVLALVMLALSLPDSLEFTLQNV